MASKKKATKKAPAKAKAAKTKTAGKRKFTDAQKAKLIAGYEKATKTRGGGKAFCAENDVVAQNIWAFKKSLAAK